MLREYKSRVYISIDDLGEHCVTTKEVLGLAPSAVAYDSLGRMPCWSAEDLDTLKTQLRDGGAP